jgi:hypothetical protein
MVLKIHLYFKKSQLKRVEIVNGGNVSIRLDPSFVTFKNGKPYSLYSPISNMEIRLFPEIVEYHYR